MHLNTFITFFGTSVINFVCTALTGGLLYFFGHGAGTAKALREWLKVASVGALVALFFAYLAGGTGALGSVLGSAAGLWLFGKFSNWSCAWF
jgi:hypothetical protein